MSAAQIRDALASLSDHELVLVFHALPRPVRKCLAKALHAELDRLAVTQ
jgi:hypothetical protein